MAATTVLEILIRARDQASRTIGRVRGATQKLGQAMNRAALLGAAALVGLGVASVNMAAKFEAAMSKSIAIMGDVSEAMREKMARAARDVALVTTFSAEQAAESYFFLASAGLDAASSIAALPKVAAFAQAGMFDMALATDLLTDAQSALGLTSKDAIKNMENMVRVSDVLVKANTLANATVEQFSAALTTEAGAALKSFGIDVEEGVAVLAAFADQGVKGEKAGSGLSRILRLMSAGALKNEDAYRRLNIRIFDSEGEMRNLADIIFDLERSLGHMSDAERTAALETLGFSARVQGVLLPLLGTSEAIRGYESNLRDAAGITDEIAEKQLQNFSAQLSLLKSRLQDIMITIGNRVLPSLTEFASWLSSHGPEIEATVLAFADGFTIVGKAAQDFGEWVLANKTAIILAIVAIGAAFIWINPLILVIVGAGGLIFALGLLGATAEDLPLPLLRLRVEIRKFILALLESAGFALELINALTTLGFLDKGLADGAVADLNEAIFTQQAALDEDIEILKALEREISVAEIPLQNIRDRFLEVAVKAGLSKDEIFEFDRILGTAADNGSAFSLLTPIEQVRFLADRFNITSGKAGEMLDTWNAINEKKKQVGGALGEVGEAVAELGRKFGITTQKATDLFLALANFGGTSTLKDIVDALRGAQSGAAAVLPTGGPAAPALALSAAGVGGGAGFGNQFLTVQFNGGIQLSGSATQQDADDLVDMVERGLRSRTLRGR